MTNIDEIKTLLHKLIEQHNKNAEMIKQLQQILKENIETNVPIIYYD